MLGTLRHGGHGNRVELLIYIFKIGKDSIRPIVASVL